jgi:hypothetical protein
MALIIQVYPVKNFTPCISEPPSSIFYDSFLSAPTSYYFSNFFRLYIYIFVGGTQKWVTTNTSVEVRGYYHRVCVGITKRKERE